MKLFKTLELNMIQDLLDRLRDLSESLEAPPAPRPKDAYVIAEKKELARLLEHPEVLKILRTKHDVGPETDEVLPYIILINGTGLDSN